MGKRQKPLSSKRPVGGQQSQSTETRRSEATLNDHDNVNDVSSDSGMRGEVLSLAVSFAVFAIYMKTLHPSIPGGDSGELIIAANELGVAHPPGYPIFTLAGKLAIVCIPFGNPAWRVNVLNAGFAASAAGVLSLTVYRLTRSMSSAVLATGLFALSKLTWTWSVTAEVFGLNNLFVASILLLAVKFDQVKKDDQQAIKMSQLGAFVCGLALCNQHTIVLYVMVVASWVLITLYKRQVLSLTVLVHIGLCFAAGLLPYLYMPISSWLHRARWTWGNQASIEGFLTHILRVEYGTFDLGKNAKGQGLIIGLITYFQHVTSDLLMIGVGMAVLGVVAAFVRKKAKKQEAPVVFLLMLLAYVFFFAWRANLDLHKPLFRGVVERFWMQSDMVIALFAGLGYNYSIRWIKKFSSSKGSTSPHIVAVLGCVLVTVAQTQRNFWSCDQSGNMVVREFAENVLSSMPANAIILTKGDLPSNSLRYLHTVENYRPDLTIFDQEMMTYQWSLPMHRKFHPDIVFPGEYWHLTNAQHPDGRRSFNILSFLDHNYNTKRPIIVCIGMQEYDHSWKHGYDLWPVSVCHQVVAKSQLMQPQIWAKQTQGLADNWNYPVNKFDETSWEKVANDEMWHAKISAPYFFHKQGVNAKDPGQQADFFIESYRQYDRALKKSKNYPMYWHKNIALSLEKLYHLEHKLNKTELCLQAVKHFQTYLAAAPDDPDGKAIQEAVVLINKRVVMLQQMQKLETIGGKS